MVHRAAAAAAAAAGGDGSPGCGRVSGILDVHVHQASGLHGDRALGDEDVYAKFLCGETDPLSPVALHTRVVRGGGSSPIFNQKLQVGVPEGEDHVRCEVWAASHNRGSADDALVGAAKIPIRDIAVAAARGSPPRPRDYALVSDNLLETPAGTLRMTLKYRDTSRPLLGATGGMLLGKSLSGELVPLNGKRAASAAVAVAAAMATSPASPGGSRGGSSFKAAVLRMSNGQVEPDLRLGMTTPQVMREPEPAAVRGSVREAPAAAPAAAAPLRDGVILQASESSAFRPYVSPRKAPVAWAQARTWAAATAAAPIRPGNGSSAFDEGGSIAVRATRLPLPESPAALELGQGWSPRRSPATMEDAQLATAAAAAAKRLRTTAELPASTIGRQSGCCDELPQLKLGRWPAAGLRDGGGSEWGPTTPDRPVAGPRPAHVRRGPSRLADASSAATPPPPERVELPPWLLGDGGTSGAMLGPRELQAIVQVARTLALVPGATALDDQQLLEACCRSWRQAAAAAKCP
eukprot:SM000079S22465  [mRNA]  locus=s79:319765:321847:- [translate_table: standard]